MCNYRFLCAFLTTLMTVHAGELSSWDFDNEYFDNMLYLHVFTNYETPPHWLHGIDTAYPPANLIRVDFGSLSLGELMSIVHVRIQEEVGEGFGVRYRYFWRASHHIDFEEQWNLLGLHKHLWGPVSVFSEGNFSFDKDKIDILYGISLNDSARTRFLEAAFVDQDHFYPKNDMGGRSKRDPYGIMWSMGARGGPVSVSSEGYYSRGFERVFPDSILSPHLRAHDQRIGRSVTRCFLRPTHKWLIDAELRHITFRERKDMRDSALSYRYSNRIYAGALGSVVRFNNRQSLRGKLVGVRQDAAAHGRRSYRFERWDLIPSMVYEFRVWKLRFTTMLALAHYRANLDGHGGTEDHRETGTEGKARVGVRFDFSPRAHMLFARSRTLKIHGFDGMNGQVVATF